MATAPNTSPAERAVAILPLALKIEETAPVEGASVAKA
jgi:hypothetical protein